MIPETFHPGDLIVSSTELIDHIYFMLEGTAEIKIKIKGVDHILEELKCRDTFGQFKLF